MRRVVDVLVLDYHHVLSDLNALSLLHGHVDEHLIIVRCCDGDVRLIRPQVAAIGTAIARRMGLIDSYAGLAVWGYFNGLGWHGNWLSRHFRSWLWFHCCTRLRCYFWCMSWSRRLRYFGGGGSSSIVVDMDVDVFSSCPSAP